MTGQANESSSSPRPLGVEIRSLNNMIQRYLSVTMPEEAKDATGGNAEIIMYLACNEERDVFPQDIERRFSITRSTSSRVLGLMERRGLVERHAVQYDARRKSVTLTDRAYRIVELLRAAGEHAESVFTDGMSEEEIVMLRAMLAKVRANLVATGAVGRGDLCGRDESACAEERQHMGNQRERKEQV